MYTNKIIRAVALPVVLASTLTLTACGKSLEDAKTEAVATVEGLTWVEEDERQDYKTRIEQANDSAAVEMVKSEATQLEAERASAAEAATTLVSGKRLTLVPEQSDVKAGEGCFIDALANGTVSAESTIARASCLDGSGVDAQTWTIEVEGGGTEELEVQVVFRPADSLLNVFAVENPTAGPDANSVVGTWGGDRVTLTAEPIG